MHRNQLLELLQDYQERYPEESSVAERLQNFVREHPDCFERSLSAGHITGSAWLVNRGGTHTLLTHHKKLNKWLQPGGHVDGNPNILESALREAQEESGIEGILPVFEEIFDIDIHAIPQHGSETEHYHYDVRFAVHTTDSEVYQVSDESHDLAWVEIQDVQQLTREESMLRMVCKWSKHIQSQEMP